MRDPAQPFLATLKDPRRDPATRILLPVGTRVFAPPEGTPIRWDPANGKPLPAGTCFFVPPKGTSIFESNPSFEYIVDDYRLAELEKIIQRKEPLHMPQRKSFWRRLWEFFVRPADSSRPSAPSEDELHAQLSNIYDKIEAYSSKIEILKRQFESSKPGEKSRLGSELKLAIQHYKGFNRQLELIEKALAGKLSIDETRSLTAARQQIANLGTLAEQALREDMAAQIGQQTAQESLDALAARNADMETAADKSQQLDEALQEIGFGPLSSPAVASPASDSARASTPDQSPPAPAPAPAPLHHTVDLE